MPNRWWLRLAFTLLLLTHLSSGAPGQDKQWDRTFGGSGSDELHSLQQTSDGGYILGGYSRSKISGDKTEDYRGNGDFWVVKLDAAGQKEWDRTFGGIDELSSLQQTSDGGYILGGSSYSGVSGDKTEASRGEFDYWVVKLDAVGRKEWDRTLGGTDDDWFSSLQQTSDGGYVLGGFSRSPISGDKTEANKGESDYWVVKLDAGGQKEWDRTYGGSDEDRLASLQQTSDGGYVLGGSSYSGVSGDKTEAEKGVGDDYWVVKLNAAGEKEWDRTLGSTDEDLFSSLQQTSDGGYILGGSSIANISGDKTEEGKGSCYANDDSYCTFDYWVVKLDAAGRKEWDRALGGSLDDMLSSLQQTSDGGYILGGYSGSSISGDKTEVNKGICYDYDDEYDEEDCSNDYWVVKLDAAGQQEWDRTFGGSDDDWLSSLQQTSDGGYILGGYSGSGISGDKTEASRGHHDYWIVKLGADASTCNQAVTGFTLVNADTHRDIMPLQDGDVIDLSIMPTRNLKIKANTTPATVGSVVFDLDGAVVAVENGGPYRYGGEGRLPIGQHTLTATPYSAARGGGEEGTALTISFSVVSQMTATAESSMGAAGETRAAATAYPNPTSEGRIRVVLPKEIQGELAYTLHSALGSEAACGEMNLNEPTKEVEFDFSRQMQGTGVYYLRLRGQGLQAVLKVVRQ